MSVEFYLNQFFSSTTAVFNNIFEIVRQDNSQTIPEGISTDLLHENLLEDLKRM